MSIVNIRNIKVLGLKPVCHPRLAPFPEAGKDAAPYWSDWSRTLGVVWRVKDCFWGGCPPAETDFSGPVGKEVW